MELPATSYVDKPLSLIQLPERSSPNDDLIDVSISIYESEWWDRDDRLLIATLQLSRSLLWKWELMDRRRSCDCTSFFIDTITRGDTLAIEHRDVNVTERNAWHLLVNTFIYQIFFFEVESCFIFASKLEKFIAAYFLHSQVPHKNVKNSSLALFKCTGLSTLSLLLNISYECSY